MSRPEFAPLADQPLPRIVGSDAPDTEPGHPLKSFDYGHLI